MQVIQLETFGDNVKVAMANGFTFTCAMCVKLHQARDRAGAKDWAVNCGSECGGPGAGKSYPKYEGPLGDNHVAHCVFCGKDSPKQAVTTKSDPNRILGVCKEHLAYLKRGWVATRRGRAEPLPEPLLVIKA